jgi:alpha-L-fucosidase 2
MLMQHSTNQNLFDTHPAREGPIFQIDGNFGATAGIAEMLMQSHTGSIDLLPALPAAWADGEVKGLRARGGVEIDLRWASRRATECRLSSESDQSIRVRPPQGQQVQSAGKQAPEGVWTVALRRGQPLKLILT